MVGSRVLVGARGLDQGVRVIEPVVRPPEVVVGLMVEGVRLGPAPWVLMRIRPAAPPPPPPLK